MKRIMILLAGVLFLFSASASVFAAEQSPESNAPAVSAPAAPSAPTEAAPTPAKAAVHKANVTHMRTYGKVLEVTDTTLKIERTVKGVSETMEFTLEKPAKVKADEMVKVRYIEKDGKNIAVRVMKAYKHRKAAKKAIK